MVRRKNAGAALKGLERSRELGASTGEAKKRTVRAAVAPGTKCAPSFIVRPIEARASRFNHVTCQSALRCCHVTTTLSPHGRRGESEFLPLNLWANFTGPPTMPVESKTGSRLNLRA